jgi:hypothetical protein
MCEMISLKECLHVIDLRGLVDGWVLFCNFMVLSYVFYEALLQVVDACSSGGICNTFPWLHMFMITIGSFLPYRDAIQLHDVHLQLLRFVRVIVHVPILTTQLPIDYRTQAPRLRSLTLNMPFLHSIGPSVKVKVSELSGVATRFLHLAYR